MYKVQHVARELTANLAMGIPAIRDRRIRKGRTVGVAIETKARNIVAQFDFFMDTIGWQELRGKTVVEIGPGDAIPLAPLFLGAGAAKYVALDRFLGDVASNEALALYSSVIAHAPSAAIEGLSAPGSTDPVRNFLALLQSPDRVALINNGIEDSVPAAAGGADYIVSFNVCEHLANLERALANMAALLGPGGRMIHRVDYGPHDIWQQYANPLAFLTVPAPIWRMMSTNRGCPNRVRHRQLLDMVGTLGMSAVDRIGTRASADRMSEVKSYLSAEFRDLGEQDIAVLDAEIVCGFDGPLRLGRSYLEKV